MADNETVFTDQDMTVANYRAFSPFSLFAFCFSVVVSLIALINHNLVGLAGLGVLFAVISIFKLLKSRGKLAGHAFSGLALVLPLFCMIAPITYDRIQLRFYVNEAEKNAETWLKLVEAGKVHEPYELTQLKFARKVHGADLTAELGSVDAPGPELEFYLRNQPEISIREDRGQGKLEQVGAIGYQPDPAIQNVKHFYINYIYTRPNGEERRFSINMRRQKYISGSVLWNVHNIRNTEPREKRHVYTPDDPMANQ